MINMYIVMLAILTTFSCIQKSEIQTYFENGNIKEKYTITLSKDGDSLKNGDYYRFFQNGEVAAKGRYKNGVFNGDTGSTGITFSGREGKWNFWNKNGSKSEENFTDGILNGPFIDWYENGMKKYETNYVNGKAEDPFFLWFKNNSKWKDGRYKNGKIDGTITFWYENGKKELERNYQDGILNGISTMWYTNGELFSIDEYSDGKKIKNIFFDTNYCCEKSLIVRENHANGNLKFRKYVTIKKDGTYSENGPFQIYYENGNVQIEGYNVNGKVEGLVSSWSVNGEKLLESEYKKGINEGRITSWYENGQKKSECYYKNGKIFGQYNEWYENGTKKVAGKKNNGKWDGIVTMWNLNGEKINEKAYINGIEEKVIFEKFEESSYFQIPSITKLKILVNDYNGKKIKMNLIYSTIAVAPYLMFADHDLQFINVIPNVKIKGRIANIKPQTKCIVYGIVTIDILGNPEIYADNIVF